MFQRAAENYIPNLEGHFAKLSAPRNMAIIHNSSNVAPINHLNKPPIRIYICVGQFTLASGDLNALGRTPASPQVMRDSSLDNGLPTDVALEG